MTAATTPNDGSRSLLVNRPDLAETALFHLSLAVGCLVAGVVLPTWARPHGIGWCAARDADESRAVITRAAFVDWAGRLLVARSSVRV